MNVSETFIRRPIATSLLMTGIAVFGAVSYRALPVADLPSVDFPTLTVTATLPGADPATMASSVATPLERQFSAIAGIDSITSVSQLGGTQISLQFDLSRNIDGAAVDVQTAISAATPLLPPGMPGPPSFRKSNPADSPIVFLAVVSKTVPMWVVDDYAETVVAQRISTISGVAQVIVSGSQKYAVHVQVDPEKLNARQIGINEVAQAVQNWNVNLPTGALFGPHRAYNVQTSGQLMTASAYRPMTVAWRNGRPIHLGEIANVVDGVEDDKAISWLYTNHGEGVRAVTLLVFKQPGSNTIDVIDRVKTLIPAFNSQLPESVRLTLRGDRSQAIRDSFRDIQFTMAATLALVILVIYLFLRNGSATFIPSIALPISIGGTFSVMYLLDYSLDNLSMMALILSVGFVVDDAIVMLENIVRHLESGEAPFEAALNGSREVGFTIVSMTLSLAAVFIPVLFMAGILGRLFREFAVTISVAILISGMVSISLTPMLCSRFLRRPPGGHTDGWLFTQVLRGYRWSLRWVLRHRPVMAGVFVIVLAATSWLYVKVPKGFIPDQDTDQMYVSTEAAQGTSFQEMIALQLKVNEILRQDPNIETFNNSIGGLSYSGLNGANQTRSIIQLVPRARRALTSAQVAEALRPKLSHFPGMKVYVSIPAIIRIGGRMSKSSYDLTIQGPDTTDLFQQAEKLEREIVKLPSVLDVTTDMQIRNPRVKIEIDRDKAASFHVNAQEIESALYQAYGPSWISTIYAPSAQYKVLLELLPKYQQHADSLSLLYMKGDEGNLVPLSSITRVTRDAGPLTINHSGQLPSVSISFNLRPGYALGEAVDEVKEVAAEVLPPRIQTSFTGTAAAFESSLKNLNLLLLIAVLVVYIVLGVLYESYAHPITILSGLPSAGFGALLTLMLFKVDLSVYAFVGLMMLVGIVKKNAIMQIDFALDAERRLGMAPADAIFEGCLTRFRPIMMTTSAAMLGALPMSFGYGSGGEARRPLGLTVVGGLICSQLITLYLTPVVYTYMAAIMGRWRRRKEREVPAEGALAGAGR
jgi:HAE1 family hydrophobic/amphiphilic exporter-1